MERFHKWLYDAARGLGVLCLWYEIAKAFEYFFNALSLGIIVGMLLIGYAYSYEDKKKD